MVSTWADQENEKPDKFGRFRELTPKIFQTWYDKYITLSGQVIKPPEIVSKKKVHDPISCISTGNAVLSSLAIYISNDAMDWIERMTNDNVSLN